MNVPSFVEFSQTFVTLTRGQRVLVSVAFDRVEPQDFEPQDRDVARAIFGDVDTIPTEARSVLVAVCGARGGKSYILCALYSLYRAFTADLSTLAAGEHAVALIVAPDLRLARQAIRYALGAAKKVPALAQLIRSETSDGFTIERPDGIVSIEALPATRGGSALRGRSLVSAVLDEAAFFRDEQYSVNDTELFKAVAPRILRGGMAVVASTPWAESGLLHSEFIRNHGKPCSAIAAHAPTLLLRDDETTKSVVAREEDRDPDNAQREFGAQFMTVGTGLFFDRAVLGASVKDELDPKPTSDGRFVAIGGDLGLVRDASAFVALHVDEQGGIQVAEILEMRPSSGAPLKLREVLDAAFELCNRHGQRTIWVDHHLLSVAQEQNVPLQLLPAPGGQSGKLETYRNAKELLNAGSVEIPGQYRRLTNQLADITSRPTSGGGLSISSPRRAGVHGDIASAFVLALWASKVGADAGPTYHIRSNRGRSASSWNISPWR